MNRNYPPAPPPYGPSPQYRRPPPQGGSPGAYVPGNMLSALINQSQKRYSLFQEASEKLDAGFGHLQLESENVLAMIAQRDPTGAGQLQISLTAVIQAAQLDKQKLTELMQVELLLQGELRRWQAGQPPSDLARASQQQQQQAPSSAWQQVPQQGWPQQQQAPQQAQSQQPQQQQQQAPLPVPPLPQGPIDYRDPYQAAAAVLRAQPMPLGPIQQQPQGGVYVPPGSYGAPPPGAYGSPANAYAQPTPVPVQMQYAQPDQAGPPNMPMPPPVTQYQTPEAAQAAVNASHATGALAPANGAGAGPKNAST